MPASKQMISSAPAGGGLSEADAIDLITDDEEEEQDLNDIDQ